MGKPYRVGIVGLGFISRAYLDTLAQASDVEVTAVADLDHARATALADSLPAARALTVPQLLASDDLDAVLNLTTPAAHGEIARGAIAHRNSVYGEKPLTASLDEGRRLMADAEASGVRLGCAPDTVLGTGVQTARAVIDEGGIGAPIAATAMMVTPGHERWHPQPDFYYQDGGGPMLDMGPYYVSALIHLLGPVTSVAGAGSRTRDERVILTGPRAGETVPVSVDSHVTGVLTHASGAISTITTSFDGVATQAPPIEVHGTEASLVVPDPNTFEGDVMRHPLGAGDWARVGRRAGFIGASRGVGLLDLLRSEGEPRASGEIALHALEVMIGLLESTRTGSRTPISSSPDRPPVVPLGDWRTGAS